MGAVDKIVGQRGPGCFRTEPERKKREEVERVLQADSALIQKELKLNYFGQKRHRYVRLR